MFEATGADTGIGIELQFVDGIFLFSGDDTA